MSSATAKYQRSLSSASIRHDAHPSVICGTSMNKEKGVALKRLRWLLGARESCHHWELFCRAIISPKDHQHTHLSGEIDSATDLFEMFLFLPSFLSFDCRSAINLGTQSSWRLLARQRLFRKKTHLRRHRSRWKARRNIQPIMTSTYIAISKACYNNLQRHHHRFQEDCQDIHRSSW
jgi:hypothetical protein